MMKHRFSLLLAVMIVAFAAPTMAETAVPGQDEAKGKDQAKDQVIEPQVDRRNVTVPHISASDLEFGLYTGILSVENFGARSVTGGRLAYHLTDRLFVEGAYAGSTVSDQFYRDRALPVFTTAETKLRYYNASVGYNLLPGESFVTKNWAVASAFYLIAGLGTTTIERENFSTLNFGFGYRALLNDWFALHLDVRDYVFNSDILGRTGSSSGKNQRTDNFEMTAGFSIFF